MQPTTGSSPRENTVQPTTLVPTTLRLKRASTVIEAWLDALLPRHPIDQSASKAQTRRKIHHCRRCCHA
eukprot:scaffold49005_cov17-Tisochrysis_lutea.AAC.1